MTMSAISPALLRRAVVRLFGAAALAFAVLTTSPALAESGENPAASCPDNADAELFRAAHRGNVERAKHLLSECGADVNARNYHNQTPLVWATRSGNVAMFLLLLDKEADVNARDKMGQTVLHAAVRDNHPGMVNMILADSRADVNAKDYSGRTPRDWAARKDGAEAASMLKNAGGECNVETLPLCGDSSKILCEDAKFYDRGFSDPNNRYRFRFARHSSDHVDWVLRSAVRRNDANRIARLIEECGVDPNMKIWIWNGAALHMAAAYNATDAAEVLIKSGADVNAKGDNGNTPLHWAAKGWKGGAPETAAILIAGGANVNAKDKYGATPLHWARRAPKVAKILLKNGANVNAKSNSGTTPLHMAGFRSSPREFAALLLENGADINARDNQNYAPLHSAARANATETAALLIENGADVNAKAGRRHDWTPLDVAAWANAAETAELLIKSGADVNVESHNDMLTPLHRAVQKNAAETAEVLIKNGADVNAGLRNNWTLLHMAALRNAAETAEVLIKNGANANARYVDPIYYNGWTPLHAAAGANAAKTAEVLIKNGADVNTKDSADRTPLDIAALRDSTEVARVLSGSGGECRSHEHSLCHAAASEQRQNEQFDEQLSAQSDEAREDLTEVVAEGINALPPSFNALATDVGFTRDMKMRLNARRDFRWDGGDWGLEAHIGAVGESDSQAAFTGVGGSKDFAGGWRVIGAAKVARGWTQLEGGLERGALWASEFSAGFERLGLFYGGDALGFGVSQPLYVEHWEAETADGRRFRGSQLSGRVLNVDASYRIPLPGGENGMMEFSAAVGRESGSESGFEGDALISAEWGF